MYRKSECVAMLLAGGQGSRLYALTERTAKPAVSFGGKYRIIDFPMSNCVNSGIYTVGVLTQYQPLVLNEYIGHGSPWDLDRAQSGVTVLPPYQAKSGGQWYKGTANAIYQNLRFIDRYDPDLSCPATIYIRWTIPRCLRRIRKRARMRPSPCCAFLWRRGAASE